jgi:hypothetical protein
MKTISLYFSPAILAFLISSIFTTSAQAQNLPAVQGVFFENKSSEKLVVEMMYTFVGSKDGYFYYRNFGDPKTGVVEPGHNRHMDGGSFDLTRRYYIIIRRLHAGPDKGAAWSNDVPGARVDSFKVPFTMPMIPNGLSNKFVAIEAGRGNFEPLKTLVNSPAKGATQVATRIEPLGNHRLVKIVYLGNNKGNIEVK